MHRISSQANRVLFKRDGLQGNIPSLLLSFPLFQRSTAQTHSQPILAIAIDDDELNSVEDALTLFNRMLRMRPLPSVVSFNQLLGKVAKMKHYSAVISSYSQMGLVGIVPDKYVLNIVINCFCHLKQMPFSLSVLGKFIKFGYELDTVTFSTLIKVFLLEEKIVEAKDLL